MSTLNMVKFYGYITATFVGVALFVGLIVYTQCGGLPTTKETLGVNSPSYGSETQAAMDVINGYVGCEFLVWGDTVTVKEDDGVVCDRDDVLDRPEDEWDHAGTAYSCGSGKYEVIVSKPGNTNTTAHIIAHELGHILDLKHNAIGIMGKAPDPNGPNKRLRLRDADVDKLRARFCK